MEETKQVGHTKGSWVYARKLSGSENCKGFRLLDVRGYCIADISARDEDGIEGEANARLMAAAPDLLAACKDLLTVVRIQNGNLHEDTNTLQEIARAAIAKAEARR